MKWGWVWCLDNFWGDGSVLAGRNSSWGEAITISCQEALRVLEASMCWGDSQSSHEFL